MSSPYYRYRFSPPPPPPLSPLSRRYRSSTPEEQRVDITQRAIVEEDMLARRELERRNAERERDRAHRLEEKERLQRREIDRLKEENQLLKAENDRLRRDRTNLQTALEAVCERLDRRRERYR